jgi:SAM-dependent methyltransferase
MRIYLARLVCIGIRVLEHGARVLDSLSRRLGESGERRRDQAVVDSTRRHDMAAHPDEQYYRNLYWQWIQPYLETIPASAKCLDLGCGQGRFSIPLAAHFPSGEVLGVDLSLPAVEQGRQNAEAAGLGNVSFSCSPLDQFVPELLPESYDLIMLTEVSFFWPEWQRHFGRLVSSLRPGGLLVGAFRPLYFNALCLVQQRRWRELDILLSGREGYLFGPDVRFSWQTSAELAAVFNSQSGLTLELLAGVGVCSGIEGDPHAAVARPSLIPSHDRKLLQSLEFELGAAIPDAGRYMLAIGRRIPSL